MRASRYFQLAHSAAKCEEFGNLSEAAVLWHQATELAVRKANRDWSAHRANVCEKRLELQAKPLRVRNGGRHEIFLRHLHITEDAAPGGLQDLH